MQFGFLDVSGLLHQEIAQNEQGDKPDNSPNNEKQVEMLSTSAEAKTSFQHCNFDIPFLAKEKHSKMLWTTKVLLLFWVWYSMVFVVPRQCATLSRGQKLVLGQTRFGRGADTGGEDSRASNGETTQWIAAVLIRSRRDQRKTEKQQEVGSINSIFRFE